MSESLTRYGIIDRSGFYWAGENRWSRTAAPARWFDSFTAAALAGLRELPDAKDAWTVTLIPERAYVETGRTA